MVKVYPSQTVHGPERINMEIPREVGQGTCLLKAKFLALFFYFHQVWDLLPWGT